MKHARLLPLVAALLAAAQSASALEVSATNGRTTLTAFDHSGWAVCSLRSDGWEYINDTDHGRCLQSAASFDWLGEGFNPTEGGSERDGFLPRASTTLPFTVFAAGNQLATEVQPAFWQGGRSNHVIRKYLTVGYGGRNVTEHRIAFEIPAAETHSMGQFEILTGYMPPTFRTFRSYDPAARSFALLTDGPGEQALPVVFCADFMHCMGAFSPLPLVAGGYGRWRFPDCVKWNMVARFAAPSGVYRFRVFTTVGNMVEVADNLTWLYNTQPR
jgi:hypothetical protein